MTMIDIGIIGDIHEQLDADDITFFNASSYRLLLCTGDLSRWWPGPGLTVARRLARLSKPTLLIPGNHDAVMPWQLLAEVKGWSWLARLSYGGQERRWRRLKADLGFVTMGGYSVHPFVFADFSFDVVIGRPFSMGGQRFGYQPHLQRHYGVASMAASGQRLRQCVDQTTSVNLIFLAHNGPCGLGDQPHALWGCDFQPELGDFGDPDLEEAIAYARARGKRILAVVAGHMHHRLYGGGERHWQLKQNGILYVNAARVPRIELKDGRHQHHHVHLRVGCSESTVTAQFL